MTYRITGLQRSQFDTLIGADDEVLAAAGAVRVTATSKPGFPCRITLEDAEQGETLILLSYMSHDVNTPYRSSYAIYVREAALEAADYVNAVPPVFKHRPLGLRGFDAAGMLKTGTLALPGEADEKIRAVFADPEIDYIHAHNAAHGCFAAKVDRDELN
jgi:hypothetical protein